VLEALTGRDAATLRSLGVQVKAVVEDDAMAAMRLLIGATATAAPAASPAAAASAAAAV
jgi:hypothetical protein